MMLKNSKATMVLTLLIIISGCGTFEQNKCGCGEPVAPPVNQENRNAY